MGDCVLEQSIIEAKTKQWKYMETGGIICKGPCLLHGWYVRANAGPNGVPYVLEGENSSGKTFAGIGFDGSGFVEVFSPQKPIYFHHGLYLYYSQTDLEFTFIFTEFRE